MEDVIADGDRDGPEVFAGARLDDPRDGGSTVDMARYGALQHLDDDVDATIGVGASLGRERTDPAGMKEDPGAAEIGGRPTPPLGVAVDAIPHGEAEVEPRGSPAGEYWSSTGVIDPTQRARMSENASAPASDHRHESPHCSHGIAADGAPPPALRSISCSQLGHIALFGSCAANTLNIFQG